MGTLATRGASLLAAALFTLAGPTVAAANPANAEQAPGAPPASRTPAIQEGHDGRSAWMLARFRQLVISKRFDSATRTAFVELRAGTDVVQLTVAPAGTSVTRNGHTVTLDTPSSIAALQQVLGGSMAVFAAREMLSQLEGDSELEAPDMALLSTAAFVASLVGDASAPRRLTDRFVAKHRGIFRRIGAGGGRGTCWQEYTVEVTNGWDDLQQCMDEAEDDVWWWAPIRRLACNGVWLMRSESAWFEYLKCLSPMSTLQP